MPDVATFDLWRRGIDRPSADDEVVYSEYEAPPSHTRREVEKGSSADEDVV